MGLETKIQFLLTFRGGPLHKFKVISINNKINSQYELKTASLYPLSISFFILKLVLSAQADVTYWIILYVSVRMTYVFENFQTSELIVNYSYTGKF